MSSGITDLDRLSAEDLRELHEHAVAMRELGARRLNKSGPLYTRLDGLVDDIEAAKWFGWIDGEVPAP
jgi:hypothetical protein